MPNRIDTVRGDITADFLLTGSIDSGISTGLNIGGDITDDFEITGDIEGLYHVIGGDITGPTFEFDELIPYGTPPSSTGILTITGDVSAALVVGKVGDTTTLNILGEITDPQDTVGDVDVDFTSIVRW